MNPIIKSLIKCAKDLKILIDEIERLESAFIENRGSREKLIQIHKAVEDAYASLGSQEFKSKPLSYFLDKIEKG